MITSNHQKRTLICHYSRLVVMRRVSTRQRGASMLAAVVIVLTGSIGLYTAAAEAVKGNPHFEVVWMKQPVTGQSRTLPRKPHAWRHVTSYVDLGTVNKRVDGGVDHNSSGSAGSSGESLKYHGGPVQHEPHLYLDFWGNDFWNNTSPKGLYSQYKQFYYDLSSEFDAPGEFSWQGILSQYFDNASDVHRNGEVVGEAHVNNINAPERVTHSMVETQVREWVKYGAIANQNSEIIILTAPGTTFSSTYNIECGEHGETSEGYIYAVVPYAGDLQGCIVTEKNGESSEEHVWKAMNESTATASHEYAEAVTDPEESGWFTDPPNEADGEEIGDLCSGLGPFKLPEINGRPGWVYVQKLWDDLGGNTCKLEDPPYNAPPPPSVTTGSVTGLKETQVTLNGTVNPNGPVAHYYFQYGTTTSYGSSTPEANAGYGTNDVVVGQTIGGLTRRTTYHYRLVATNFDGTSYGEDHTFKTATPVGLINISGASYSSEPLTYGWTVVSPSDHPSVISVSGSSVGYIDSTGAYWSKEVGKVPFTKLCGPEAKPTAISVSGTWVGLINSSGAQYSPEPSSVEWSRISSASNRPSVISVGGTGVGYIDSTGAYWSREPRSVGFTQLTGAEAKPTAISVSGTWVGLINTSGAQYSPEPLSVEWSHISPASYHPSVISVGGTGVGYIDSTGAYWSREPRSVGFTQLTSAEGKPTAISVNGESVGLINVNGAYWSTNPLTVGWTQLSSASAEPTAISVG